MVADGCATLLRGLLFFRANKKFTAVLRLHLNDTEFFVRDLRDETVTQ